MKANSFLYFIYKIFKILYILSTFFISLHNLRNIELYQSEIKLIIKCSGYSNFLSNDFNTEPYEVIINGEIKNSC